nr:MAG TPA: hypothetical protein [Bacteriophage sp.]DAH37782.1 MAG TPA: hypothetical protein [Caudoviricetes sp.]
MYYDSESSWKSVLGLAPVEISPPRRFNWSVYLSSSSFSLYFHL